MDIFYYGIFFVVLAVCVLYFVFLFSFLYSFWLEAVFVPTPRRIAIKMLELAKLKEGEVLCDLGCGMANLPILAASKFGAKAIGVEKIPIFYLISRARVGLLGLRGKVKIMRGDLFKQDISKADVVTVYLSMQTNARLKKKFEKELAPGSRVISRGFKIPDWPLAGFDEKDKLYLYKI